MTLDEIINGFTGDVADIVLYQRAAKETAARELEYLNQHAEQLKNNPSLQEFPSSVHRMFFYDPDTGMATSYGFRESSVEDRIKQVLLQKNKQYCWLLAEAYEKFEDFLEAIYAFMGMTDNAAWPMSDFGDISISDLPGKDYGWYLSRAKNKRNLPQSILARLRHLHPRLADAEVNHKLNVNLRVAIEVIQKLRHFIVHRGGTVNDTNAFVEEVLKGCGLWNNGKYVPGYRVFVERFFGNGQFANTILLLEIRVHPQIPINITHDTFEELVGYLIAYSVLIYRCILG